MNTNIYVMTHKKCIIPDDDIYIPLHVGRNGHEDLGYVGDNTGCNISMKNPNYCELTGMFWAWKNIKNDIIGVCHYRRYFFKDGNVFDKSYIESVLSRYDIIIRQKVLWKQTIYDQYKKEHKEKDMIEVRKIISEKFPEYIKAFDHVMAGYTIYLTNMFIAPKTIFDDYCEWLFEILFELEKRIDISDYDDYQKRIFGFISERLFNVWIANHELKIKEEEVFMVEL